MPLAGTSGLASRLRGLLAMFLEEAFTLVDVVRAHRVFHFHQQLLRHFVALLLAELQPKPRFWKTLLDALSHGIEAPQILLTQSVTLLGGGLVKSGGIRDVLVYGFAFFIKLAE